MRRAVVLIAAALALAGCKPAQREQAAGPPPPAEPAVETEPAPGRVAFDRMFVWEGGHDPASYAFASTTVTFSGAPKTTVTLTSPNLSPKSFVLEAGLSRPHIRFGAGRFDPRRPDGQVVFTTYTGGAHCCEDIRIATRGPDGWEITPLGEWDGELAFPTDLNGDGYLGFRLPDQRFLYAFDCYACSWAPPVILNVRDGRVFDVSKAPGREAIFEEDMLKAKAKCAPNALGPCAGYAADAARLGRKETALAEIKVMFKGHAFSEPQGREVSTCPSALPMECKGAQVSRRFKTFPEALEWFLDASGY